MMAKRKRKPKPKPEVPAAPPTSQIPEEEKALLADLYRTLRRMYSKEKKGKKGEG